MLIAEPDVICMQGDVSLGAALLVRGKWIITNQPSLNFAWLWSPPHSKPWEK